VIILITQDQLPMVAIPSMNDTHLEEILIVNKLNTAISNNNVKAVSEILDELLEHTIIHFLDEEAMMQEAQFPAFEIHKGEHDRHIHELKTLINYFEKNKDTKAVAAYVEGNLERWFIHHIETMDTMTAMFLEQNKVVKK
jgi:hemerythrin